jgi:hypothetical protein
MKQSEVKMGETYRTYIGQFLCRVVVVGKHDADRFNKRTRFVVRRVGETRDLPKARTAASLRPIPPGSIFPMKRDITPPTRTEPYAEIQDILE